MSPRDCAPAETGDRLCFFTQTDGRLRAPRACKPRSRTNTACWSGTLDFSSRALGRNGFVSNWGLSPPVVPGFRGWTSRSV